LYIFILYITVNVIHTIQYNISNNPITTIIFLNLSIANDIIHTTYIRDLEHHTTDSVPGGPEQSFYSIKFYQLSLFSLEGTYSCHDVLLNTLYNEAIIS
jgi:hypothetical protein